MVHAAPGGHVGICGPLPQTVLKTKVHVDSHGPTAVMLMSVTCVTTTGLVDVRDLCGYVKLC